MQDKILRNQSTSNNTRRDLIYRVFVSSTFQDMKAEREALQKRVFPHLREYCRQRGARFQAVDLRWGVSEESAYDQQTMKICLGELERCQQVSPRPNFVVLLGQRYGWVPLPAEIESGEFSLLQEKLKDDKELPLLEQWYWRDDNAVPAEFILLPRKSAKERDFDLWREIEKSLQRMLQEAAKEVFGLNDPRRRKYFESATHQEINHGALSHELDSENHVLAFFRDIDGAPADDTVTNYIDADQKPIEDLRKLIRDRLGDERCHIYSAIWSNDGAESDLDQLCNRVRKELEGIIDDELTRFQAQPVLVREQDAHREFGMERCEHFTGREEVLHRIKGYLDSDQQMPLVIHGHSGFGKTALMAKAWRTLDDKDSTVVRFIGATPESVNLRSLLQSLCRQIGVDEIPEEMSDLVDAFRNRLSNGGDSTAEPTFLFLDALDQLDQADNARWLNWLPTKLAPGVKVVLSVLDDEDERQCYDVATRKWPDRMVSLGQLQLNEGETVLEAWLRDAGRTLQKDQRRRLLCIFAAEGSPLFLKLAFEQARRWRSWERNANVASNVKGLLSDLFTRLDREHGRPTVAAALTYIALAKHGLTEDELMDVLSRDGKVMTNFFAHSPTECAKPESERLKSLPLIIWSRLFTDIERYMNQRRADGTVVMDFYHRQVVAAVRDTYLADEATVQTTHEHLAGYFDSLDYWIESLEARTQRMPPSLRPINVRKVVELPYHRLEAAKIGGRNDPKSPLWNAIAELLTDWEFLEAKAEADPNYNEPVSVNEEAENDF